MSADDRRHIPPSGNLLHDEPPLTISPSLAALVGLNEAIILQQLHYWLVFALKSERHGQWHEDRLWVYNTYEQWQEKFPFWSVSTIKRTISALEGRHLILSAKLNRAKMDRTRWYTIDYAEVERTKSSLR